MQAFKCDLCRKLIEEPTEALPLKYNGIQYFAHVKIIAIPGLLHKERSEADFCENCLKRIFKQIAEYNKEDK